MKRGKVIKPKNVVPFTCSEIYTSKMLIDKNNSESNRLQINEGTVAPSSRLPDGIHKPPYDEAYVIMKGKGVLHMNEIAYEIEAGDVAFIPGGTPHSLENTDKDHELVIITVWPEHPEKGVNGAYDMRKEQWGETYRTI